jgi:predicted ATPase/class 3 adenylate cyclase
MSGLPGGTVTFLFTDIEGSTRLLRRLGERYAGVLERHDRLVRAACANHGGREVDTQGDAFFMAFARAGDAVAAAVAVQRALATERWPEGAGVRVRMGLHTGEPIVGGANYVGLAVHRAARICAVGHGGQILVSSATREVLEDDLRPVISFRDLGERRLKDFDRPEHLFQVVVDDLAADFPPLASVPVSPAGSQGANGGVPAPPNRTLGRNDDVRAIAERLRVSTVRLLTLTGPGGVGKTRLAIEAAGAVQVDFADTARFVSLDALRRAKDVPSAIARALAIVPLSGETSDQAVTRSLAAKDLLLILDNFEHLLPAARFVSDLLTACPGVTVLATSREPLMLHAEERYPVSPLTPPALEDSADRQALAELAAVTLFCERARARDPGFRFGDRNAAAVAEICRRVDGLPLAIELAAARCELFSPGEIANRLHEALGALGTGPRDAPARQRTLRATIDWSHDLLSDAEQAGFARFAAFAGGATVGAVETITGADVDTLDHLVVKSLLVRRNHSPAATRLGMLETIHAYAAERFAAIADHDAVRERHYRFYLGLAREHGTEQALWGTSRSEHLARLDAEIDNLHAALGWAVDQADAERAVAIAEALGLYWVQRNGFADALEWIDRALRMPGADANPTLRVRALCMKANCLWTLGRAGEQRAALAEAETIARALGDPVILSRALHTRAHREVSADRLDAADRLADEALSCAHAAGDRWEIALASYDKALAASTVAELRERVEVAASMFDEVGNVYQLACLLTSAAYAALCLGSDRDATDFAGRAIPIARSLDDPYGLLITSGNLALGALLTGDVDAASRAFREELRLCRELVVRPIAFEGFCGLAAVAVVGGDVERAATLVGAAAAHRYGEPEDPVVARLDKAFFEPARTRHGAEAWDAGVRDGSALSFEDAIAYALEEPCM